MDEFTSQAEKFIRPEHLRREIERIIPGAHISEGRFDMDVPGYANDMEWNHMDQSHRNWVHDSYHDSMRVVTGRDFAMSVTRFGNLPIFIQVSDVRLSRTVLYQMFNVFGLIYCHLIVRFVQKDDVVSIQASWYTASHKLLRVLHGLFNRRFLALQKKQAAEDLPIRERRYQLRLEGFSSTTDRPDFLNSNVLTDNLIPPDIPPTRTSLGHLHEGAMEQVTLGPLAFHVQREGDGYLVWPAICSHEGAMMPKDKICGSAIQCPWHGRRFDAIRLGPNGQTSFKFAKVPIRLESDSLVIG